MYLVHSAYIHFYLLTYLPYIHTYIHIVYTSIAYLFIYYLPYIHTYCFIHHTLHYRRHVAAPVSGVSPPPWQIQWPVTFTAQPLLTLPLTSPPCWPFPSPHSGSSEGSYQAWMISSEWWPLHLHLHHHQQVNMITYIHTSCLAHSISALLPILHYVHVCMYVCMYVCVYVYVLIYVSIHTMHVCMCICISV